MSISFINDFVKLVKDKLGSTLSPLIYQTSLYETFFCKKITVYHKDSGFKMEMLVEKNGPPWKDYDEHTCHEPATTQKFVELLNPGDEVWDIGSFYGYFALLSAHLTRSPEKVHVFEPDRKHIQIINKNNELYFDGKIDVIQTYLGDSTTGNTIKGDDYFHTTRSCPKLVKVDVDGSELSVIKGMMSMINECSPNLLIEIHFPPLNNNYAKDKGAIFKLLASVYPHIYFCRNQRRKRVRWNEIDYIDDLPVESPFTDYMLFCTTNTKELL